jgi:hypothetical protein
MDNCSSHTSDDVIAILTRERVKIIAFTPHTTHIFKMLDVVLFRVLKKYATGLRTLEEGQTTAAFISTVYHDFKRSMIDINIWMALRAIGFTHDIDQIPYGLLFDEVFRSTCRNPDLPPDPPR